MGRCACLLLRLSKLKLSSKCTIICKWQFNYGAPFVLFERSGPPFGTSSLDEAPIKNVTPCTVFWLTWSAVESSDAGPGRELSAGGGEVGGETGVSRACGWGGWEA
eukprot:3565221-Pleurochrysis_carterae.AAC.1